MVCQSNLAHSDGLLNLIFYNRNILCCNGCGLTENFNGRFLLRCIPEGDDKIAVCADKFRGADACGQGFTRQDFKSAVVEIVVILSLDGGQVLHMCGIVGQSRDTDHPSAPDADIEDHAVDKGVVEMIDKACLVVVDKAVGNGKRENRKVSVFLMREALFSCYLSQLNTMPLMISRITS